MKEFRRHSPSVKNSGKVTTTFSADHDVITEIDRLAAAEGISRSEYIRWILKEYVTLIRK